MAASLYKGKIPVVVRDLNEGFVHGGKPADKFLSRGAVPRDFSVDPVEMRDSPSQITLVKDSEWDALYDAGEVNEDSLEHIYLRGGKPAFEFLDQNGFPDCWCHSTAHAVMLDRAKQNLPPIRLNAVAIATLMGRTDGGWCGLSMKYVRENGIPEVGTGPGQWPYQSRHGSRTAEVTANMAKHKGLEDWYDMGKAEWDQKLANPQFETCLFNNLPTPSDYNEFGHSMLSLRRVRTDAGRGTLTLNSWKSFGYFGLCVLLDRWPDGSCSLRSSTPSS